MLLMEYLPNGTLDDVFDRMVEIARKAETEVNPNFLEGNG